VVLKIEGFDVPHVHVHLIPCEKEGDSYRAGRELEEPNYTLLAEMAQKLAM
jgi:diadenosine tetraphosphate (Ap4A) HIT family hydrolase